MTDKIISLKPYLDEEEKIEREVGDAIARARRDLLQLIGNLLEADDLSAEGLATLLGGLLLMVHRKVDVDQVAKLLVEMLNERPHK
jgi:hypothetical protein